MHQNAPFRRGEGVTGRDRQRTASACSRRIAAGIIIGFKVVEIARQTGSFMGKRSDITKSTPRRGLVGREIEFVRMRDERTVPDPDLHVLAVSPRWRAHCPADAFIDRAGWQRLDVRLRERPAVQPLEHVLQSPLQRRHPCLYCARWRPTKQTLTVRSAFATRLISAESPAIDAQNRAV